MNRGSYTTAIGPELRKMHRVRSRHSAQAVRRGGLSAGRRKTPEAFTRLLRSSISVQSGGGNLDAGAHAMKVFDFESLTVVDWEVGSWHDA